MGKEKIMNRDLILDLTIVIILSLIGQAFRNNVERISEDDLYNWDEVRTVVGWRDAGGEAVGALQEFSMVYFLIISRWLRICRYNNLFEQHDLLHELFWILNVVLFAIAGVSIEVGQVW